MITLHLIPELMKGGAERQLGYLATHWANTGREVHIAYLTDTPVPEGLVEAGVHLHPLAHAGNYDPLLLPRLVRLVRRIKPDIVHTWLLQMDILGGVAALLTDTPYLLREPANGVFWTGGAKTRIRRWIGGRADAIVSNSAGGDAYWAGIDPAVQRFVIPNVVPFDGILASPKASADALGFPDGRPVVVSAGRLEDQKNFEVLIRGMAGVVDRTPAGLVIFGHGSLQQHLQSVIDGVGLQDRIRLAGQVPSIWGALKSARVFVSLSRYEGNPNVVLEAMACGCPLVVSDIPAHRELLDETMALFVERYENPDAVAAAVRVALEDSDAAAVRAQAARARLDRGYSAAAIAARYDTAYRAAIAQHRN